MNITINSIDQPSQELCNFIIDKLGISERTLKFGLKRCSLENSPLPIVMWSYGLITLPQLEIILSWQKDN